MIEIFKTDLIRAQMTSEELDQLGKDFAQYKESGIPADYFGRDALYNHINSSPLVRSSELQHIHILTPANAPTDRRRQFNKTSDDHLVYCNGYYSNQTYLLISLLSPDAHAQSRNNNVMYSLAQMADKFREKN